MTASPAVATQCREEAKKASDLLAEAAALRDSPGAVPYDLDRARDLVAAAQVHATLALLGGPR